MRRRIVRAMCASLMMLLACVVFPGVSHAIPSDSMELSGNLEAGELSDRYESLNSLGNSLTEEEIVVIETRIGVLTSVNRALDDSEVSFVGEVVGDVVKAPQEGYMWANASGAANTVISLFLSDGQAALIANTGSYHARGTSLKVMGTYHVACPEHQGELDVHAVNVEVVDAGGKIVHVLNHERLSIALLLCMLAAIVLVAYAAAKRFLRRREDA